MTTALNRPKTGYVNVRIDKELKAKGDRILKKVGVRPTDLITMLYRQIVLREGVPFNIQLPNAKTQRAMSELDAGKRDRSKISPREAFDRIVKKRN